MSAPRVSVVGEQLDVAAPPYRLCVLCGPEGCALCPGESHADPPSLTGAEIDLTRSDWLQQYRRLQALHMHATEAERRAFAAENLTELNRMVKS